ncbi:MAG TPA: beta-L-arabinofuranosidase domain-containing protein [Candidatus Acidoferrum sp.]|nr:beta-L-arabinofuranosidase domain-containing protein [Candidatus Acidoferrum sp.]
MPNILRRDFLKAVAATGVLSELGSHAFAHQPPTSAVDSRYKLRAFNYDGVRLAESRWSGQFQRGRDFYLNVSNDDILQGFRSEAGLPCPGSPLGGWCEKDSATVFGQWLSGMSRIYCATGDSQLRDKAVYLTSEFSKTVGPDGNCRMRHYPYEKLVCGLVDMQEYAEYPEAIDLLERCTDWASKTLDRTRAAANPHPWEMHSGKPLEWYTLSENLYRGYVLTGNPKFKEFGDVWLYHDFWNKFADTSSPANATGVHAYSHVNTFSSAAMAYAVTGDPIYLRIIKNAYDFMQDTQCYATGGYGPVERLMPPGSLGKALEFQPNDFEAPCGSWAGFKLSRYLTQFTGEARYGDWAERLLYNGIGAALEINGRGTHFYYADYRVAGGVKIFTHNAYTCCSGTYIQDIATFHDLIYYKDDSGLYVSLYLPSSVTWDSKYGSVKVTQDTRYPEDETSMLTLEMAHPAQFPLSFRIPEWSRGVSLKVNGAASPVTCTPGTWAVINRTWTSGDRVEIRIPLPLRLQAVDEQHPRRVAFVRGPVVMVQDGGVHEPVFRLPDNDADTNKYIVRDEEGPAVFRYVPPDGKKVMAKFRPFYSVGPFYYYRMYFDLDALPVYLWQYQGEG